MCQKIFLKGVNKAVIKPSFYFVNKKNLPTIFSGMLRFRAMVKLINLGFKQRVIAISAILLTLSLSISSYLSYYFLSEEKTQNIDENISLRVDAVSNTVESWIGNVSLSLQKNAPFFAESISDEQILLSTSQIKNSSQVFAVIVGYENGSAFSSNSGKYDPKAYDPRGRGWYKAAKEKGGTIITDIYTGATTKKLMVSIAEPFYEGKTIKGVLLADLTIDIIAQQIVNRLPESGIASLFDERGIVVASSSRKSKPGETAISLIPELAPYERELLAPGYGYFDYPSHDKTRTAYHNQIELGAGKSWFYVVSVDEETVYQSLDTLINRMLLVSVVLLLVSIAVLVFVLQRLFQPIIGLQQKIKALTEGDGDLTKHIEVTSKDEIGNVAMSVNTLMQRLGAMISETKLLGDKVGTGMDASTLSASEARDKIDRQMNEVDQLATAMNQMSVSAKEVANHSQLASESAQSASNNVDRSAHLVESSARSTASLSNQVCEAVTVVSDLNTSALGIGSVLSVITDIAGQTNLLALNAAIEAARAGDSGRGFAVVADEVRKLAQKTQQSTEEIGTMIESLQSGAKKALEVMEASQQEVGQTLEHSKDADIELQSIREAVAQITDMIYQIASAAEEQSLVCEEVNRNAQVTKDISAEVSRLVNEMHDVIKGQKQNVSDQNDVLGQFTV
ncbi:methyl-accepting chemotaxis protein [Grimontia kaedaensis]|uniref:Methyl-accepting chemotaxis protein n=1 Tax=Grimontia kaedaensis TaxID=2872157 RepID=A0ABY4WVY2_9GAMM|nr:methyl-accepting chemotaxis protein [Grimontia kaedaensis]USH03447.1 methyl-accepting chemotaxis protein [Grimontia kaedaensis]